MSQNQNTYVLFELGGSLYGLHSAHVRHIEMFEHVSRVPDVKNPAIEGVVFSRGQVHPALNLRVRFGLPRLENSIKTRVIFSTVHDRTVGLIVDTAREFRVLPNLRPMEETLTGINDKYLKGVSQAGDRLVLILDLEAVLNVDDVRLPESASAVPQAASQPT